MKTITKKWSEKAEKVLRGYEQWEANLLLTNEAWRENKAYPQLTAELFDELLELQKQRNEILNNENNQTDKNR